MNGPMIDQFLNNIWVIISNMENGERATLSTGLVMLNSMKSVGKEDFSEQAQEKIMAPFAVSIMRLQGKAQQTQSPQEPNEAPSSLEEDNYELVECPTDVPYMKLVRNKD